MKGLISAREEPLTRLLRVGEILLGAVFLAGLLLAAWLTAATLLNARAANDAADAERYLKRGNDLVAQLAAARGETAIWRRSVAESPAQQAERRGRLTAVLTSMRELPAPAGLESAHALWLEMVDRFDRSIQAEFQALQPAEGNRAENAAPLFQAQDLATEAVGLGRRWEGEVRQRLPAAGGPALAWPLLGR